MKDALRLTFIDQMTNEGVDELWQNCFAGKANNDHMNAYVPYAVTHEWQLNHFLTNQKGYRVWLIKRKTEQDIIGFAIHGNYFPGLPNNVGFNIGLNYTRNGFATETLLALINYVREIGLQETYGHCYETNIFSIRTMKKCGFQNMGKTGRQFNGNFELKFRIEL